MLGQIQIGDPDAYDRIQRNQDLLGKDLAARMTAETPENELNNRESKDESELVVGFHENGHWSQDLSSFPKLSEVEVMVIFNERLDQFFNRELDLVVRASFLTQRRIDLI
jgi:hypothetical protein